MRARLPDREGVIQRGGGVRVAFEIFGHGEPGAAADPGNAEAMIAEREGRAAPSAGESDAICRRVRCPVRVLHGSDDRCQPLARGRRLAELTGGDLVVLDGAGHLPHGRDPVQVTNLITEFADQITGAPMHATTWTRGPCRPRRALYLS